MKQIGKITAKLVFGDALAEIAMATLKAKAENKTHSFERFEIARIQGRVDKSIAKPSTLNPENIDVKLTGEFIATNVKTGEAYQSGTLYPMGAGMTGIMVNAEPGSMFALRIFLAPSAKAPQGYAFDFESALEVKASEAVARLGDAFLALPAPAKKDEPQKVAKGK